MQYLNEFWQCEKASVSHKQKEEGGGTKGRREGVWGGCRDWVRVCGGDSGVSSLRYPSGPQCVTQALQLCHYGRAPPAAVPACVSLCTCVWGGAGYRAACLPRSQFNFSGTVHSFYNMMIHSQQHRTGPRATTSVTQVSPGPPAVSTVGSPLRIYYYFCSSCCFRSSLSSLLCLLLSVYMNLFK